MREIERYRLPLVESRDHGDLMYGTGNMDNNNFDNDFVC